MCRGCKPLLRKRDQGLIRSKMITDRRLNCSKCSSEMQHQEERVKLSTRTRALTCAMVLHSRVLITWAPKGLEVIRPTSSGSHWKSKKESVVRGRLSSLEIWRGQLSFRVWYHRRSSPWPHTRGLSSSQLILHLSLFSKEVLTHWGMKATTV